MESTFLKRFKIKLSKHNGNFDIPVSAPIDKKIKDSQIYGKVSVQTNQNSGSLLSKNQKNLHGQSPILPEIKPSEKLTITSSASQKAAIFTDVKTIKNKQRQQSVYIQNNYHKKSRRDMKVSQSLDFKGKEDLDIFQEKSLDDNQALHTPPNSSSPIPINSQKLTYASRNSTVDSVKRYRPYTMRDYVKIKTDKYMMFGGLGPNIGSENWKKASEIKERMAKYYKLIQDSYRSV
ncbi:unnamed protein product [Blepharisma stoltei]|uniref:Uncharacterized protein n=1 Tax=Blepharisma stoltei TaxID=1481888 RepID=A0AAU9K5V2_9CILI|nr:unnamed protein product [Blepharisma stoltei]